MKKWFAVWMLVLAGNTIAQSVTGDIIGKVMNFNDDKPLANARAIVEDQDKKYVATTGEDGRFRIPSVPVGKYTMYIVYKTDSLKDILVDVPIEAYCNLGTILMNTNAVQTMRAVPVGNGRIRLVHGELPIKELTSKDLVHNANKFDIKTLATSMSSEIKVDDDGQLMFRGARKGDMIYILDGVKSNEVYSVPSCSINRMMVYTGGLPAKYGDTLGGAIVVETKGYFDLYRAYMSNQE
ncbi:MAG: carboxypeptidase-like regulatory domain-containing protein [Flavobacteriales bacterium]